MRSKKIIEIIGKVLPDGGADLSCREYYQCPVDSAKTAVVKAMMALNHYAMGRDLGMVLWVHDAKTGKRLAFELVKDPKAAQP